MLPMPTGSIYHICSTKTIYPILALTLVFLSEDTLHYMHAFLGALRYPLLLLSSFGVGSLLLPCVSLRQAAGVSVRDHLSLSCDISIAW